VQGLEDPLSPPAPSRPANAPPTYEDAMKFVNDAFHINDEEERLGMDEGDGVDDCLPPSYSETPKAGEEVQIVIKFIFSSTNCFSQNLFLYMVIVY